jgi:hypothetical protein|tara:strand:- start:287 stop:463 length:177 start_codon:yes stop_codon:yes gene_type:complete
VIASLLSRLVIEIPRTIATTMDMYSNIDNCGLKGDVREIPIYLLISTNKRTSGIKKII